MLVFNSARWIVLEENEKHKLLSSQLKVKNENQGFSMTLPEQFLLLYSYNAEIDKNQSFVLQVAALQD